MPLRDHFHPPLSVERHWHSFHNGWAMYLAAALNRLLPDGYFAEPNVQFGIQIDVAAWEASIGGEAAASESERNRGETTATATATALWSPPAPNMTVPFRPFTEIVEVAVFSTEAGPTLVGAIELVSPANKDRAANRNAFVSKCNTYLHEGVGLVIVDVVTNRKGNLHHELLASLDNEASANSTGDLYVSAYRPVEREDETALDVWAESLQLGRSLPTMTLWLRGGICLAVELEETYEQTCRDQRIGG